MVNYKKSNGMATNLKVLSIILIAVLTAVDQLIKMFVVMSDLEHKGPIEVIPNLLQWNYLENTGASFGIFQNMSWMFMVITIPTSIYIIYLLLTYKKHNFLSYYAAIAIVAGGFGNFIDRFVFGYVIDYIYVMFFPYVFNFADCLVVTGVIAFVIYFLFYMDKEPKKEVALKSEE